MYVSSVYLHTTPKDIYPDEAFRISGYVNVNNLFVNNPRMSHGSGYPPMTEDPGCSYSRSPSFNSSKYVRATQSPFLRGQDNSYPDSPRTLVEWSRYPRDR